MKVSHSVTVKEDLTWEVCILAHQVDPNNSLLSSVPQQLDTSSLQRLLVLIEESSVCPGNPDEHFIEVMLSRKEHRILHSDGNVAAYVDDDFDVNINGTTANRTVRTSHCAIIVQNGVCESCHSYRSTLRSLHSRWTHRKSTPSKHTNNRYLSTPEKESKLKNLMLRAQVAEAEVKRLKERINSSTLTHGVQVDKDLHADLVSIMMNNNHTILQDFPPG